MITDLLGTIQPEPDDFKIAAISLSIYSKIIGKAFESIIDLNIRCWSDLKANFIKNFADKSNSITILNNILSVQGIKNPQIFLYYKRKF